MVSPPWCLRPPEYGSAGTRQAPGPAGVARSPPSPGRTRKEHDSMRTASASERLPLSASERCSWPRCWLSGPRLALQRDRQRPLPRQSGPDPLHGRGLGEAGHEATVDVSYKLNGEVTELPADDHFFGPKHNQFTGKFDLPAGTTGTISFLAVAHWSNGETSRDMGSAELRRPTSARSSPRRRPTRRSSRPASAPDEEEQPPTTPDEKPAPEAPRHPRPPGPRTPPRPPSAP